MTAAGVISAIVATIKAMPILDGWFRQIVAAWMQGQEKATMSAIVDAAASAARAESDADRYAAAEKWRVALSRSRILP
jgi:hypothetical protein